MQKQMFKAPYSGIAAVFTLLLSLFSSAQANTQIIDADIHNVEPIYMNYTVQKVITPCQSQAPGCYQVSYQKQNSKVLQGYRVKLSHQGKSFTTRMLNKPASDKLRIRVRSDLLEQPSTVAINAAVAYQ